VIDLSPLLKLVGHSGAKWLHVGARDTRWERDQRCMNQAKRDNRGAHEGIRKGRKGRKAAQKQRYMSWQARGLSELCT
jgi:hypothetical protein